VAEHAPVAAAEAAPIVAVQPVVQALPEATPEPVMAQEPAPVAPIYVSAPAAAPKPVVDPEAIERALQQSGLVLIQTDRSRVAPVAAEPEVQATPRPKRERRPPPPAEPLMQVETGPKA
jgi:hypothetical protein